jgi:NADPH:quinone reductase-like Zn-dependent oxidoreductase
MQFISCPQAGSYEQLHVLHDQPIPKPGIDEVLVAVEFTGVNYADVCVRMGLYSSAKKYVGWPITVNQLSTIR